MEKESCRGCRFWNYIPYEAEDEFARDDIGKCRRYAPKQMLDGEALYHASGHDDCQRDGITRLRDDIDVPLWTLRALHPITDEDDWCGDFVALERQVKCSHCGEVTSVRRSTRRFCSDKCRTYALRKKKREVT